VDAKERKLNSDNEVGPKATFIKYKAVQKL